MRNIGKAYPRTKVGSSKKSSVILSELCGEYLWIIFSQELLSEGTRQREERTRRVVRVTQGLGRVVPTGPQSTGEKFEFFGFL